PFVFDSKVILQRRAFPFACEFADAFSLPVRARGNSLFSGPSKVRLLPTLEYFSRQISFFRRQPLPLQSALCPQAESRLDADSPSHLQSCQRRIRCLAIHPVFPSE